VSDPSQRKGRDLYNSLTDTYAGYFSSLNCVSFTDLLQFLLLLIPLTYTQLAWSPDSRFLAVGGQDDLITLFSPREARVVARCQGHSAFVTSIAFDPARGEGRGYRFASVGEDGKLVLVRLPSSVTRHAGK
jgi:WD40 repeat protein